MLVLSRHRNERVVIGGGIIVTIVDIRGDKVRLGIEAPKNVPVNREEVQKAIDKGQDRITAKADRLKAMELTRDEAETQPEAEKPNSMADYMKGRAW